MDPVEGDEVDLWETQWNMSFTKSGYHWHLVQPPLQETIQGEVFIKEVWAGFELIDAANC